MIKSKELSFVALFAALTAVGGFISIPFYPVPLTLQVFFVLLSGALLGKKLGALSQIVYLGLGAIGAPVFHNFTGGIGILLGPTGGFLFGFIPGAYVAGLFYEKFHNNKLHFSGLLLSIVPIYTLGILWLSFITGMPLEKAVLVGGIPFIPGDFVKSIIVFLVEKKVKNYLKFNI
ncbi:MAG: BioY family protein [Candidatus Methanofastidiosum methylothiophilum]|uniref:BioY family protein n=1 Tax=Candidatus Methanofastidiosum methylothiophilum TaxID=1705564 RepID=A0A150IZ99_9EURY|nr:MAG: BioY family protein [Candidatus Methanofastidiosum methylthiophilus]KYC47697.1 MAG: BioY family protein [Candidatus Methanofastidiosum methylthiophilus]KYC50297.1 MAG: BioY family protein [Candidatus Methanofastidiosum methylthiophilus]